MRLGEFLDKFPANTDAAFWMAKAAQNPALLYDKL
jgi:hypothetical protein